MVQPLLGAIVLYRLTAHDAAMIARRRTTGASIAQRMAAVPVEWPAGAQAHIGNTAHEGDDCPMLVVRQFTEDCVNGQVFLDGCDVLWVTSAHYGAAVGHWRERPA